MCGKELSRETVMLPASDVTYLVVSGEGATWVQGSKNADQGLQFVIKRSEGDDQTLAHFLGIRVDDEPVSESNYTVEAGSVVITLLPEYLETLSEGAHTMEVLFDDGPAVAVSFNVKKQSNTANDNSTTQSNTTNSNSTTKGTAKAPSTGDGLLTVVCTALFAITVPAGALSIIAFRRRRE
jgi:hypothetical protein